MTKASETPADILQHCADIIPFECLHGTIITEPAFRKQQYDWTVKKIATYAPSALTAHEAVMQKFHAG
jgi:hypothetical protein